MRMRRSLPQVCQAIPFARWAGHCRAGPLARTYPGFACGEAVHGDEGAVELAELVRRIVAEEGDPHD
jgi:hypothetical protein